MPGPMQILITQSFVLQVVRAGLETQAAAPRRAVLAELQRLRLVMLRSQAMMVGTVLPARGVVPVLVGTAPTGVGWVVLR